MVFQRLILTPEELTPLVDKALALGASYGEAAFHRVKGFQIILMNGSPITASYTLSEGVRVRVIAGGSLGFSATDSLEKHDIVNVVEKAVRHAKTTASLVSKSVEMSDERLGRARYEASARKDPEERGGEDLFKLAVELYKSIDLSKYKVNIESFLLGLSYSIEEKSLATSDGGLVESRIPRLEVFYSITASSEGNRANRWQQIGGSGGLELIDELGVIQVVEDDLRSLELYLRNAKTPPKGRMDVVLGPEVVGLAMHESIGHPSEADRVLGREAAQAGLSYRRRIMPGEKIGSDLVTVIDDPTIPSSYGFYLYDDEAVPARPRYLILRGVLNEYLHNRETAAIMGTHSNGSARTMAWWSEPIIRMANTYMAPGDYSLEELIEDVKDGVYIKKYMEWNIDDYRWVARYVGFEAYKIRNGRLEEPVRNPALEVNTREFFSSIDAVGSDLRFYAGTCGKGEPAQGVPVWMGGPSIRLRGVMIK